jgi:hypothetical protein
MPRKRHSREINLIKTSQTDTSERRNTYQRFRTVLNSVLKKREKKLKEGEELYNLFCLEKKGKTDLSHRRRRRSARPGARGGARARAARCCRRWPASGRWSKTSSPAECGAKPLREQRRAEQAKCKRAKSQEPSVEREEKVQGSRKRRRSPGKSERCVKRKSSEEGNAPGPKV